MANKYYSINTDSNVLFIDSIKNALLDRYGAGVTIHHCGLRKDNKHYDLVFSCPQISEKVFQFTTTNSTNFDFFTDYSDAPNPDGFANGNCLVSYERFYSSSGYYEDAWKNMNIVLGDSFMMMVSNRDYKGLCIIGKTVGGVNIGCGFTTNDLNTSFLNSKTLDLITGKRIKFVSYQNHVFSTANMPYKTKLLIHYTSESEGNMMLCLPDGTPDTIKDLYMSMYCGTAPICTLTGLFSPRDMNSNATTDDKHMQSSLLAEFDA